MIKLTLPDIPPQLAANETALVREYLSDSNKKPWRKDYIVNALLKMSNSKCAYSEVRLNEEGNYMEVDHFKHKSLYPQEVVRWGNLLPSCKTCNTTKGTWDVLTAPIVNPLTDNPHDYLFVKACRFYKRNDKGQNTIDAVGLNDDDNFVVPRFKEASYIVSELEYAWDALKDADTPQKKHNRIHRIKSILEKCGPKSAYSAVIATFILYDWPGYSDFETFLRNNCYWDNEFEQLKSILAGIAMPE